MTDEEKEPAENETGFSDEQKNYLQGYAMGADVARTVRGLPVISDSARTDGSVVQVGPDGANVVGPDALVHEACAAAEAAGGTLCNEEKAKQEKHPMDLWGDIAQRSRSAEFPKGTDVFLSKAMGLFYVAPAQDSYMCRMRIPGGHLTSVQFRGLADMAEGLAGGYVDVTTRNNLQFREIPPENAHKVLVGLRNLGIINQGSGGDNVRNVTSSPLSGIDPAEVIETLPLAQELHWYLINHRELYGLPRKFNISFDGRGSISPLSDTNDIGFFAVEITDELATAEIPAGVYFQVRLGGITGHLDLARPTSVIVAPEDCSDIAGAILKVFIKNGNRTDRKKARLKYLLDDWGFEKFMSEVEVAYGKPLLRIDNDKLDFPDPENRIAHVGFHSQKQVGKSYVGLVLPVGRIQAKQVRGIADIADQFGSGIIRLTVWQNLLIPEIDDKDIDVVKEKIEALGLHWNATSFRAGLVACTGNRGCKFAASDTKGHSLILADYLEKEIELDQPLNIHLTGCHHSCAQHYIGDIGLMGTNVEVDDDMVEGYQVVVGGGYGSRGRMGRVLFDGVAFDEVPPMVHRILDAYIDKREDKEESFVDFAARHSDQELIAFCES
jgi:ferredoxin-nitrite reductase